jgi:hypothetical protein
MSQLAASDFCCGRLASSSLSTALSFADAAMNSAHESARPVRCRSVACFPEGVDSRRLCLATIPSVRPTNDLRELLPKRLRVRINQHIF